METTNPRRAVFEIGPLPPGHPLDFEPDAELAARIREGINAHLASRNDDRPLHMRGDEGGAA